MLPLSITTSLKREPRLNPGPAAAEARALAIARAPPDADAGGERQFGLGLVVDAGDGVGDLRQLLQLRQPLDGGVVAGAVPVAREEQRGEEEAWAARRAARFESRDVLGVVDEERVHREEDLRHL